MRKISTYFFIAAMLITAAANAQNYDNPGEYMTAISNAHVDINKKYMTYMSAVAHGRRARKVEKLREQTVESINESKYKTSELPIYKGDNTLRESSIDYIKLSYAVFNDDYSKIVNMEDIAEQSVDEMQAYILLQEKTNEKIKEAFKKMQDAQAAFAAKYKVTLIDGDKSELSEKMDAANKINHYVNKVYMAFFKCNWEDGEIVKAMNAKKVNDVEQGRNALIKYANEGLSVLDTLKPFENDPSLSMACREALQFYKKMAQNDLPKISDFYLKEENFSKIKKAFDNKPESDRKQQDVDTFNKGVGDLNAAVAAFNQINNSLNSARSQMLQNWNKTQKSFSDIHMPHYKA